MNEYQKLALKTADLDRDNELYHLVLGLVGESGEIAEKVKKVVRDHGSDESKLNKEDIAKELGDVLWYIAVLSEYLGLPLEDIAQNNIDKLAKFSVKQRTVDYAGRLILNDKDEPVISFGKHKGNTAREVYFSEPSYYAWIDNGDFTLDTKRQFARLKAQYEEEKLASRPAQATGKTASAPRTKGYTPFEGLGDLFTQQED